MNEKVKVIGESGKEYEFLVSKFDSNLDEVPAIYIVVNRLDEERGKVIYIGQTKNLKDRFSRHDHEDCFIKNGANYLCIHVERDVVIRLNIETDLVNEWNPPCNKQ